MASSINADNGVSSGSAGLKSTADSSGVLALQTNGTTAISIDASQAVSFTNQPTYSGGTANGVAYLNGSKVLTTGSALVFDGSNLGLGVTPSAWTGVFKAAQVKQGSISTDSSNNTTFANNCYFDGSNWKYINTAASQQYLQYAGQHIWTTAASGTAGNAITFTTAMTLDAGGNLGLGVTPSAWATISPVMQIGGAGGYISAQGTAEVLRIGSNNYFSGGFKYVVNGNASRYDQTTGTHAWFTAPSGTAGNAITFTQAMTLNANGVLALQGASTSANGVGITFPATQSASTDANTLDDYEEGTWTPTIIGTSGGSCTMVAKGAYYTKVGNLVSVFSEQLEWTSKTTLNGNVAVSGLPFTAKNAFRSSTGGFGGSANTSSTPMTGSLVPALDANNSFVFMLGKDSTNNTYFHLANSNIGNSGTIFGFSFQYQV